MSLSPLFFAKQQNVKFQITSTMVGSTNPTAYTAGSSGSRVYDLAATAAAPSSAISLQLAISTGGTPLYKIGNAFTPSTTGSPTDVYTASGARFCIDTDGNRYIALVAGDQLQIIPGSSIASGVINITGPAADY